MSQWVMLCPEAEAPTEGTTAELETHGVAVCLARVDGEFHAIDNWCPHRRDPLGAGWVEGNSVVCPWHSWAFNVHTGIADAPETGRVAVFPVKVEDGDVMVNIG